MQFAVYDANEESKNRRESSWAKFSIRKIIFLFAHRSPFFIQTMWKHFQWTDAAMHRSYRSELYEIVNCVVNLCHTFQWFFPLSFLFISLFYDLSIAKGREVASTFHFAFMRAYVISPSQSIGNWNFKHDIQCFVDWEPFACWVTLRI